MRLASAICIVLALCSGCVAPADRDPSAPSYVEIVQSNRSNIRTISRMSTTAFLVALPEEDWPAAIEATSRIAGVINESLENGLVTTEHLRYLSDRLSTLPDFSPVQRLVGSEVVLATADLIDDNASEHLDKLNQDERARATQLFLVAATEGILQATENAKGMYPE